jgi:hypothetical protein
MNGTTSPHADLSIVVYLLTLAAGALLIVSILYWLMQPRVYPNPGLSAYRPPRPDPIIPRVASQARDADAYQVAIDTAKRENELYGLALQSTVAANAPTPPNDPKRAVAAVQRKAARVRREQSRPDPRRAWAYRNNDFDFMFR